jgi:hypothetical protein
MRTNRKVGARWFASAISARFQFNKAQTDSIYFFYRGGMIEQDKVLPQLRFYYSRMLLTSRRSKYEVELAKLKYNYILCQDNPGRELTQIAILRMGFLRKEINAISNKINHFDFWKEASSLKVFAQ